MGLGLLNVREIIRMHEGGSWTESEESKMGEHPLRHSERPKSRLIAFRKKADGLEKRRRV